MPGKYISTFSASHRSGKGWLCIKRYRVSTISSRRRSSRSPAKASAKAPTAPSSKAWDKASLRAASTRFSSCLSEMILKSGERSSRWKNSRTISAQKLSTVPMCAWASSTLCRRRWGSPGFSRSIWCRRASSRARISAAAAFVKVTMSILSALVGFSGSVSRWMARCTSTAVLPEPAAAATSTVPLLAEMASCWLSVQRISAMGVPSFLQRFPHFLQGLLGGGLVQLHVLGGELLAAHGAVGAIAAGAAVF